MGFRSSLFLCYGTGWDLDSEFQEALFVLARVSIHLFPSFCRVAWRAMGCMIFSIWIRLLAAKCKISVGIIENNKYPDRFQFATSSFPNLFRYPNFLLPNIEPNTRQYLT